MPTSDANEAEEAARRRAEAAYFRDEAERFHRSGQPAPWEVKPTLEAATERMKQLLRLVAPAGTEPQLSAVAEAAAATYLGLFDDVAPEERNRLVIGIVDTARHDL